MRCQSDVKTCCILLSQSKLTSFCQEGESKHNHGYVHMGTCIYKLHSTVKLFITFRNRFTLLKNTLHPVYDDYPIRKCLKHFEMH